MDEANGLLPDDKLTIFCEVLKKLGSLEAECAVVVCENSQTVYG